MKDIDLLCFGEPLAEFAEVERGGERLMLPGFGGDTMNAAVAAARQGARVAVFTALGEDVFGRRFLELWDREGIDRSSVLVRPGQQTGLYFITYGKDGHDFSYARAGSAASRVGPADLPLDLIARSRILHMSAVGQAISDSGCDAVFAALRAAREVGTLVSYDTNLRLRLWPLDRAQAVTLRTASLADILRLSFDDAVQLTGIVHPDSMVEHFLGLGAGIVAMTLGAEGAILATNDRQLRLPPEKVDFLDASGAGDAFSGAFLAEYLRTGDPFAAAGYANLAAAMKTEGRGAVTPIPRRAEVEARRKG